MNGSRSDDVTADGHDLDDEELDPAAPHHVDDETLVEPARRAAPALAPAAVPERIGRYTVRRRIGAGGMGVVYEAHDDRIDRRVALKLLRDRGNETERLRLVREAQALAKLNHPHVVQVFEAGTEDERPYLVMELVEGTSLDRWLRAEPRGVRAIVEALLQAGEGLAAAHAAGIVHRDFKPGNVLVGSDGRVRVLDFGLARASDGASDEDDTGVVPHDAAPAVWEPALTRAGALVGTPAYMSPEQLGTAPVTAASDQFAFCVVLYEALYRQHPFAEPGDVLALLHDILVGQVRPPPVVRDVTPRLRAAVLRGLAREPAERWPSMVELLHALRAALRPPAWRRWAVGMAAAVTVTAGGAWALVGSSAAERPAACTDAKAELAEVWGPSQRAAVEQALLATQLPYAGQTWERVAPRLDAYGEAWRSTHARACEAGPHDAEELDRRMACLARLRRGLVTQLEILAQADATVLEQAVAAVDGLQPPPSCLPADSDGWAAPDDPERAARYATLAAELDHVEALHRSGKYRDALTRAERLLADVVALAHPPLEARTRLSLGEIHQDLGAFAAARQALEHAYFLGQEVGDARTVRTAADRLVFLLGVHEQDIEAAQEWARHAEAELERNADPLAEASLLVKVSALHREREEYGRALETIERSLSLYRANLPPDRIEIAWALSSSGIALRQLNRIAEAIERQRQAVAIAEAALGPAHPEVAKMLGNLAAAQLSAGDEKQAAVTMKRAVALQEDIVGPRAVPLAQPLSNLSVILSTLGRYDEAEQAVRRAIAILEETGAQPNTLCNAIANLAATLHEAQRYEPALAAHRRALAACEQAGLADHLSFARHLRSFGDTLEQLGQLEESDAVLRRALAILDRSHEAVHDRRALVLYRLTRVSLARSRHEDAIALVERALAIEPGFSPGKHFQTAMRWMLAQAYWGVGRREEALGLAREVAALAGEDHDHPRAQQVLEEIRRWQAEHDPKHAAGRAP